MLFKIHDYNNKFVEYATVCVNENDFSSFFNHVVPKLQSIKLLAQRKAAGWEFNSTTYKSSPIKIWFYGETVRETYSLDEMISSTRKKQMDAHSAALRRASKWTDQYFTYAPSSTFTVSNTYSATSSFNLVFDGYGNYRVQ